MKEAVKAFWFLVNVIPEDIGEFKHRSEMIQFMLHKMPL